MPAAEGAGFGARPSRGRAERGPHHRFRGVDLHVVSASLVRAGRRAPLPDDGAAGAQQEAGGEGSYVNHKYKHVHVHVYLSMYAHTYVRTHVCTHARMCVCVYLCMYV